MKVVCFGDSLTSCGGPGGRYSDILQDRFPRHVFVNKGIGGESFVEARERFAADVLDERPDVLLIELGANDWWRDERPYTAWGADLEEMIVRARSAGARVVVLGVFGLFRGPAGRLIKKVYGTDERAEGYQRLEERLAGEHGCRYVANIQQEIIDDRRCWEDRNHPNEYGNRHVADAIEAPLGELLGDSPLPLRKPVLETTRDFWREAVQLAPNRLAVVDGDHRLTFKQADEMVERIAGGLYRAAGGAVPKVALYLPNSLEYFLIYWAVQRLGGAVVPLNTWLKEDAVAGIFRSVQPEILVVRGPQDEMALRALGAWTAEGGKAAVYATEHADHPLLDFQSLIDSDVQAPVLEMARDTLSIIMHTSGTTSAPKGAMMRHSDLMFNVAAAINAHSFSSDDIHLLVNPMFHCTALYSSLPTAAYQKTPVVIVSSAAPELLMEVVQKERITTFLSVPTVFQKILSMKDLDRFDWSSLRVMAFAGSPMPVPAVHALRERFPGVSLHNFFGLTETISMTHVLRNDDVETRPDSIGRLLPFVEARIVDDKDQGTPPGTPGELLFAREEVIPGYYHQPGRLEEACSEIDGKLWFRTGDLAVVDEEGYFTIKGRKKDMIIVGGENVFSAEVEAVLAAHEKVAEAAVKGVPAAGVRSHLGELVKAYIVRSDASLSEADLRRHCYERLPSYKVPAYFVFLDALPRNPAGKVVKDELQ